MIIGLTGTKASGKEELVKFFTEKGYMRMSLSDEVRQEAVERGIKSYTIKQLQDIGNELRERFGNEILAKRVLEKLDGCRNCVVEGIRNTGEIEELRKKKEFTLIAVDAPRTLRFQRIVKRGRDSDPKNWKGFLKMEKRDLGENEENTGQQVKKCIEMADIVIFNDNNSIDELRKKIEEVYGKLK